MEKEKIKKLVAKYISEGIELSEIQDLLKNEHNTNMTFFELRMLAATIDEIDWKSLEPEEETNDDEDETENVEKEESSGTVVEVSKLVRPGAVANGSVKFASGATADWVLDQMGRLGLDKPVGEPTPEDLEEFKVELQNALAQGGL